MSHIKIYGKNAYNVRAEIIKLFGIAELKKHNIIISVFLTNTLDSDCEEVEQLELVGSANMARTVNSDIYHKLAKLRIPIDYIEADFVVPDSKK